MGALLAGAMYVGIAGVIGLVLYAAVTSHALTYDATDRGRQWAAAAGFVVCISMLPRAISQQSADLWLKALLGLLVLMPLAFVSAWTWASVTGRPRDAGPAPAADDRHVVDQRMSFFERVYFHFSEEPSLDNIAKVFLAAGLATGLLLGIGLTIGAQIFAGPGSFEECMLRRLEQVKHESAAPLAAKVCRKEFPR